MPKICCSVIVVYPVMWYAFLIPPNRYLPAIQYNNPFVRFAINRLSTRPSNFCS